MTRTFKALTTTALATVLALPMAAPVLAQDTQTDAEISVQTGQDDTMAEGSMTTTEDGQDGEDTAQADSSTRPSDTDTNEMVPTDTENMADTGSPDATTSPDANTQADPLIVMVGDSEINASDVNAAIASFPQQMQQQPPEALVPFAVEQLVLRELILQEVESESMGDSGSSETASNSATSTDGGEGSEMANADAQVNEDNQRIQGYLTREMEGVVTEDTIQQKYDELKANADQEIPPLEAVRPQIEQQLRQQKIGEIRQDLGAEVEIVYYGPDGKPRETSTQGSTNEG